MSGNGKSFYQQNFLIKKKMTLFLLAMVFSPNFGEF